ncbi:Protease prsW family (plasmid) [Rubrobacter radiotolerans]|uniref:Protease prsW family n=1 Tax=Rubrobacter radiotolerans TaxID=42256 RepID=A0A023X7J3_RUBRA|nr:PrsW family intramembrane metalloprotease [Rubrobacter radiotolerans]AHY48176.1 Protease prsW family [Rubrobacter radiotolerans]MDX5895435.1 PrsW family intramembrane metalloprotease [Rubrobacter radiotolerans]SMC01814.1 Membrane proteinase PrsW, cleaves anti-sigma factor RsiW, M82 family [Rubrobacter radiotolerans DSM 5868]
MRILRRRWLQIFVSGLVLLFLVERTLVATQNPNFFPSVILLGAFLVPVTLLTYLYERQPEWEVPLPALATCFLWGGVLGTVVAGTLEYEVAVSLGFLPKLLIGFIEESAKLIVPLVFYFLGRYRSESAGILLGVTTAAGFAGLETMGYGFLVLLQSQGNLATLDTVLILRGLTSPAGHLAWTGIVAAVLWRERLKAGRPTINRRVIGAFATVVVLHALWDTFQGTRGATFVEFLSLELISLAIAVVSVTIFVRRVREADRTDRAAKSRVR